jgi:GT2 family glycosyltransferase
MNENDSKWAACIVYYEDLISLNNLVNNLANQTLKPAEIFISDNNSKNTVNVTNTEIKISTIKLKTNKGFGSAANTAVEKAIENKYSKFILFSQDVNLENDSCFKIIQTLNDKSGIVFPTMINRKNNQIFSKGGTINYLTGSIKLSTNKVPKKIKWADGSCLGFDQAAFEKLNGFFEKYFMYFEDVDFCARAVKNRLSLTKVDTHVSQIPNGPKPFLRSRNSIILARRLHNIFFQVSVTKRNFIGAIILFAKFRFADSKQRMLGIFDGWKSDIE